jgi:hypothetical protein
VELALKYLENPQQLEQPQELPELDDLVLLAIKVLNSHLKMEREVNSLH